MSTTDFPPTLNTKSLLIVAIAILVLMLGIGGIALDFGGSDGAVDPLTQQQEPRGTAMHLQPSETTVVTGNTTTYNVVLENADGGVGAYDISLSIADQSTASITDVVEYSNSSPQQTNISIADDGSSADVQAEAANTSDSGSVVIAVVTVRGDAAGSSYLELNAGEVRTETDELYTVTETSGASITVDPAPAPDPANIGVDTIETNSPVLDNETLEVDIEVTNTGDERATQAIDLTVGQLGTDNQSVRLDGGESTTVSLSVDLADGDAGDAGDYTATIDTGNESESLNVTVEKAADPAVFEVASTETTTPVVAGEPLEVIAEIENTGDEEATQDVNLTVETLETASRTITLNGGESTTVTFNVETEASDAGNYTVSVGTDDDSDTGTVAVTEPPAEAFFDVTITDTNAPVKSGQTLDINVTVENTGDLEGTQTVQYYLDGDPVSDTTVNRTLAGGENFTFRFTDSITTPGEYEVGVRTEDTVDTRSVKITESPDEAFFSVRVAETNNPAEEGETLEMDVVVKNLGETTSTQEIDLTVGELGTDSTTVTLDGQKATTVPLSVETDAGDAGDYTATVASADDTDSATTTIAERDLEPVYWQVDFSVGAHPPIPPSYWPNDLLAALGNSDDGVTQNPSVRRQRADGQLGDVTIVDNEFMFDDEGNPTEVTVEFEIDDGGVTRDLHLAVYTLPGPFDIDELDQQELFETTTATYDGGETGELTVTIPQENDD